MQENREPNPLAVNHQAHLCRFHGSSKVRNAHRDVPQRRAAHTFSRERECTKRSFCRSVPCVWCSSVGTAAKTVERDAR